MPALPGFAPGGFPAFFAGHNVQAPMGWVGGADSRGAGPIRRGGDNTRPLHVLDLTIVNQEINVGVLKPVDRALLADVVLEWRVVVADGVMEQLVVRRLDHVKQFKDEASSLMKTLMQLLVPDLES